MAATFQVLYDFQAEEDGELGVFAGDFVNAFAGEDGVFGTGDDSRDGWVLVEQTHAPYSTGYVPADYLEKVATQARAAGAIAVPLPQAALQAAREGGLPGNTKGYSSTHLAMGFANVRAGTQKRRGLDGPASIVAKRPGVISTE